MSIQLLTNAVLDFYRVNINLSTVLGPAGIHDNSGGGAKVYDHEVPEVPGFPYVCLYQIPGGSYSGPPLTAPESDLTAVFQVDAVGTRRDQAQWLADKVFTVTLGRAPNGQLLYPLTAPGGWRECARLAADTPPGVIRDPTAKNPLYSAPQRFAVAITPSA